MNLNLYHGQDIEVAVKGKFDAVLDTIGRPETERIGINFLRKGGNYMTLQVYNSSFVSALRATFALRKSGFILSCIDLLKGEAASLTDRYGFVIGLPLATSLLAKKKIQYQYSHGIGKDWILHYSLFSFCRNYSVNQDIPHGIGIHKI